VKTDSSKVLEHIMCDERFDRGKKIKTKGRLKLWYCTKNGSNLKCCPEQTVYFKQIQILNCELLGVTREQVGLNWGRQLRDKMWADFEASEH